MCSSRTSKPARTRVRAVATYAFVTRVRSASVADFTICIDSGLGIGLGGDRLDPVGAAVGDRAGVADLPGDRGAGLVDRVGHPRQARERVLADDDLLAVGASLGRDGEVGDGRQADAAAGDREVVVDQAVGDLTLGRAALEGRGLDGAVAQGDRPELDRCEDVWGCHARTITRSSCRQGSMMAR